MTPDPIWVIMPIAGARELTVTAIADVLNQSVPTRLLLINQGVEDDFRAELEAVVEEEPTRIFLWSHVPPLPSLSATWNRALEMVWKVGGEVALVVNNDVRLHRETIKVLRQCLVADSALFVSAIGVSAEQFNPDHGIDPAILHELTGATAGAKGGPDFSCFLISRDGHTRFPFDEHFTPAYCEDIDYHRTLLLAGEGDRIFSVNLPFLHYRSGTLGSVSPARKQAIERAITNGSRAYYERKWGGPVNEETYLAPFGGERHVTPPIVTRSSAPEPRISLPPTFLSAQVADDTATTPYLQAHPPTKETVSHV